MYLAWEPSLSERRSCDLRLKVAEINNINGRTGQTKRDLRHMLIREGVKRREKLRRVLIRLFSENGVSRRENFNDGFSQERNMHFLTIIQKNIYKLFTIIIGSGNISHMINFYRISTFGKFNLNCSTETKYLMYFTSSLKVFTLTTNKSVVRT